MSKTKMIINKIQKPYSCQCVCHYKKQMCSPNDKIHFSVVVAPKKQIYEKYQINLKQKDMHVCT